MTAATRSSTNPLSLLKKEFIAVGLEPKRTFQSLPDWWEDAITHPSGLYEIRGFVAKYFGMEIGPDGHLRQRNLPHACFKTRRGTPISEVASARALVTAVAKAVSGMTVPAWNGHLLSAADLRKHIIDANDRPWVSLADLLSVCWSNGIPVIYLPDLPISKPKMEGMVTFVGGRPAILLTKKASHPAWMLFILAHEMGHLASGHLEGTEGAAIVDEKVTEGEAVDDAQEIEANGYALQCLTGGQQGNLKLDYLMPADDLAAAALQFGAQHHIDPGHVVLNAVSNTRYRGTTPWPLANAALKAVDHDAGTAADICRAALRDHVDSDRLSDDAYEFLERLGVI